MIELFASAYGAFRATSISETTVRWRFPRTAAFARPLPLVPSGSRRARLPLPLARRRRSRPTVAPFHWPKPDGTVLRPESFAMAPTQVAAAGHGWRSFWRFQWKARRIRSNPAPRSRAAAQARETKLECGHARLERHFEAGFEPAPEPIAAASDGAGERSRRSARAWTNGRPGNSRSPAPDRPEAAGIAALLRSPKLGLQARGPIRPAHAVPMGGDGGGHRAYSAPSIPPASVFR